MPDDQITADGTYQDRCYPTSGRLLAASPILGVVAPDPVMPRGAVDIEALSERLRSAYMTASRVKDPADWPDVPECQREAWRAVARAAVAP